MEEEVGGWDGRGSGPIPLLSITTTNNHDSMGGRGGGRMKVLDPAPETAPAKESRMAKET
jgi:hypothetical protein